MFNVHGVVILALEICTSAVFTVYVFTSKGHTDKKGNKIFHIYKEIQIGSGAKSYVRKGFLYMRKCSNIFPIYEEVVSHK